jgi:hypothetical protein
MERNLVYGKEMFCIASFNMHLPRERPQAVSRVKTGHHVNSDRSCHQIWHVIMTADVELLPASRRVVFVPSVKCNGFSERQATDRSAIRACS